MANEVKNSYKTIIGKKNAYLCVHMEALYKA